MKKKKRNNWPLIVTILAFTISLLFSFMSESVMPKVGIIVGIMILILFIFIGIIFDMIGVAVTSSNEEPLHAMSSKKIKGAKKAVSFKKNADKVSSFCNDVIGDICGIISGSAGVSVAKGLASTFNLNIFYTGLIVTALIAALTIGGKAFCKRIAIDNNHKIVYMTAKVISKFEKKRNRLSLLI
ncbi:MAG: hypothetical protein BHW38_04165 [Firmicutes bacterium CAG:321_26_22]|nr:MAG: hypothetical protein BHW38_04165 [Firmicutes bacterium CAG:321_26_22]